MELQLGHALSLIVLGFLGAFINAIVGGGGLITLPALLAVGLPPAMAIGTNKLAATFGNLTSMLTFLHAGKVSFRLLAPVLPVVFIGSVVGASTVHLLDPEVLRPLIIVLLIAVLLYSLSKKDLDKATTSNLSLRTRLLLGSLILVVIGFYDGFFGPGTGSFFIFVLLFMGLDFMQAAGSSKLLNLASNSAALLVFLLQGTVHFGYGIVMGVAMIVGAYLGSKMALSKGTAFVKLLFVSVTMLLIVKNIYDFYFSV